MGGEHRCPVCQATFTRPQHVARHMRSHTGDRPYKCTHCGDQFARSDLLSRHVAKCHPGAPPPNSAAARALAASDSESTGSKRGSSGSGKDGPKKRKNSALAASRATTSKQSCDQCVIGSLPCDGSNPCGKCIIQKQKCTYVKFHRQTAPVGPGHRAPSGSSSGDVSSSSSYLGEAIGREPWSYGGLHSQSAIHHDPRMYAARQHAMLQDTPMDLDRADNSSESALMMNYNLGLASVPPPFPYGGSTSYGSSSSSRRELGMSNGYEENTSLASLASLSSMSPPLPLNNTSPLSGPPRYVGNTQDINSRTEIFLRPHSTAGSNSGSGSGGSGGRGSRSHSLARSSASPRVRSDGTYESPPLPVFATDASSSGYASQSDSPRPVFSYPGGEQAQESEFRYNAPQAQHASAWQFNDRRGSTAGSEYSVDSNSGYESSYGSDYSGRDSRDSYNHFDSRPSSAYDSRPSSSASSHRGGDSSSQHENNTSGAPFSSNFEVMSLEESRNGARRQPSERDAAPFFTTAAMNMTPADPNATPMPSSMMDYTSRGRSMHTGIGSNDSNQNNISNGTSNHNFSDGRPAISRFGSGRSMSVTGGYGSFPDPSGVGPPGLPSSTPGRETETRELREFWKQYMRTPLTGPGTTSEGGMNLTLPRPGPTLPMLSPLRGDSGLGMMSPGGRFRGRVNSMPTGKTPVFEAAEWTTMQRNYAQRSQESGDRRNNNDSQQQQQRPGQTMHGGSAEDLRSYEAAVLARKAPTTLNLMPKKRRKAGSVNLGSQGFGEPPTFGPGTPESGASGSPVP